MVYPPFEHARRPDSHRTLGAARRFSIGPTSPYGPVAAGSLWLPMGMQTLDQCLVEMVRRNQINVAEARNRAVNKDLFMGG